MSSNPPPPPPDSSHSSHLNFEQLQKEIDDAERYLRHVSGSARKSITITHSQDMSSILMTSIDQTTQKRQNNKEDEVKNVPIESSEKKSHLKKRYSDPTEREKLLQRLLAEHHSKHSTPTVRNVETTPKSNDTNNSTPSTGESEPLPPHQLDDTLFYASDITPAKNYYPTDSESSNPPPEPNEVAFNRTQPRMDDDSLEPIHPSVLTEKRYGQQQMNKTFKHGNEFSNYLKEENSHQKIVGNNSSTTQLHEPGKKRILKSKEELVKEAKEEFSRKYPFHPTILPANSATPSPTYKPKRSVSVSRIDAMLRVHEQNLVSRDKQRLEVEKAQVARDCTFRPEICPGTNAILQRKDREDEYIGRQPSRSQVIDRVNSDRTRRSSSATPRRSPPTSATERLYRDAEKKQQHQAVIQQKMNEIMKSEFPFQPSINPRTDAIIQSVNGAEYRPIYERVGDVQRTQVTNKQILTHSYEEMRANELTFQPKIDKKSELIVENKRNKVLKQNMEGDQSEEMSERETIFGKGTENKITELVHHNVGMRLLDEGRKQLQRKYQLIAKREKEMADQVKTPKPCKGSEQLLSENPQLSSLDFASRQANHSMKTKVHVDEIRKEEELRCGNWFKPTLSETTQTILLNSRQNVLNETVQERVARLAYDDAENIDQNRLKKEQEIYGEMTFSPIIDPISRELGQSSSLRELYENRRGKRAKDKIKTQAENKESAECSFKPSIQQSQESYKKYLKSIGKYPNQDAQFTPPVAWGEYNCPLANMEYGEERLSANEIWRPPGRINMKEPDKMAREIRSNLMEKEQKRQNEIILKEIEELQECTFQPKIHSQPKTETKPVVVRGLGRHLELRNLLQRQKEHEKKRKEDAFRVKNVEKYRNSIDGSTVVQPFRLHEPNSRRSRAALELEEEMETNLTFSPTTNDFQRREMARRIISHV